MTKVSLQGPTEEHEKRSGIFNKTKIFVTFCSGYLWSWNKTHSCYQ